MLKTKTALVTGSISGLGFAIANQLAQAGASIVLHGLESVEIGAQARQKLIKQHEVDVMVSHADLRQPTAIEEMMQLAELRFGRVDIVVNNAVVRHFGATDTLLTSDWDEALAVNLSAAFHTARLALPAMREVKWGRIINISSVYGQTATANRIAYITTKTALIGLTRAIAMDAASDGITCNALCPGTVPTPPIVARIAGIAQRDGITLEQAESDYISSRHPTGRFVAMENVGALAVFVCSDAGQDITGAVLPIDGGWTVE